MSRELLHESMKGKDWEDIVLDLACANERLEARIADLEKKLLNLKVYVARTIRGGCLGYFPPCLVCGALGDEKCDAGLHG